MPTGNAQCVPGEIGGRALSRSGDYGPWACLQCDRFAAQSARLCRPMICLTRIRRCMSPPAGFGLHHRVQRSREDPRCDLQRALGRRDRRRRFAQHRRHGADRRGARRAGRADRVPRLRRPAQPRDRSLPRRLDLQPRFRRALHTRSPRRDPATHLRARRARCLPRAAAQLVHGPLDPRLRLVSELPPAAALQARRDGLYARAGARRLSAADRKAARRADPADLAVSRSPTSAKSSPS